MEQKLGGEILNSEQIKGKNFNIKSHGLVRGVASFGKSLILRNGVECKTFHSWAYKLGYSFEYDKDDFRP